MANLMAPKVSLHHSQLAWGLWYAFEFIWRPGSTKNTQIFHILTRPSKDPGPFKIFQCQNMCVYMWVYFKQIVFHLKRECLFLWPPPPTHKHKNHLGNLFKPGRIRPLWWTRPGSCQTSWRPCPPWIIYCDQTMNVINNMFVKNRDAKSEQHEQLW